MYNMPKAWRVLAKAKPTFNDELPMSKMFWHY